MQIIKKPHMKHLCSSKARWINQEVISQPVLVVQKVLKNF